MNQLDIIDQLKDDVDLLLKPDAWLTAKKTAICQQLSLLASDLRSVVLAIKIKHDLQQTNLVAVQRTEKVGNFKDCVIRVMPLPDAVAAIRVGSAPVSQIGVWAADGYDVAIASALR